MQESLCFRHNTGIYIYWLLKSSQYAEKNTQITYIMPDVILVTSCSATSVTSLIAGWYQTWQHDVKCIRHNDDSKEGVGTFDGLGPRLVMTQRAAGEGVSCKWMGLSGHTQTMVRRCRRITARRAELPLLHPMIFQSKDDAKSWVQNVGYGLLHFSSQCWNKSPEKVIYCRHTYLIRFKTMLWTFNSKKNNFEREDWFIQLYFKWRSQRHNKVNKTMLFH